MKQPVDASANLRAHASDVRHKTVVRLRETMRTIEAELKSTDSIYPHGKLNQRELCRRAGISQATLQKPAHRNTTLLEVNVWLARVAKPMRTKGAVHATAAARVQTLRDLNRDLMQHYHESELELVDALDRIARLEARLSMTSANGNSVSPITSGKPR